MPPFSSAPESERTEVWSNSSPQSYAFTTEKEKMGASREILSKFTRIIGGIILKKFLIISPWKWCKFSFWSPLIVPYYVDFWLMVLVWIFKIPETLLYFYSIFITCISPLERSTAPFYNNNFVTVLAGKDFQKYLFSKGNLCKIFLTQLN